jgi:3D (Asp-Asp-Asp) domain-containing protein
MFYSMSRAYTRTIIVFACLALGASLLAVGASGKAKKPISKPMWLTKTTITEYYPALESWFVGEKVKTPGISGRESRIDWLYSAKGIAMEGDGVGSDGKRYHIEKLGSGGWIARNGKKATFGSSDTSKQPFWRSSGYWRNKKKGVTFRLHTGEWFAGEGKRYVPPKGITFGPGPSRDLTYYRSVAVDPKLIPMGSLVYVGKYKSLNGDGWFRADDVGGAIIGHHIDVYRKPPDTASESGRYFSDQRIYVVPKAKIKKYVEAETKEDTDKLPVPPSSLTGG